MHTLSGRLSALLLLVSACLAQSEPLHTFNEPPSFSYEAWENKATVADGQLCIQAPSGVGGLGYHIAPDLTDFVDHTPTLTLTIHRNNKARLLRVQLLNSDGQTVSYLFDLSRQPSGREVTLRARGNPKLGKPVEGKPFDNWATVTQVQLQGDWTGPAVDVCVREIGLLPPGAKLDAPAPPAAAQQPKPPARPVKAEPLTEFDSSFLFTYGSWEGNTTASGGQMRINTPNAQGGGGYNIERDLSSFADHSPTLTLTINAANQADLLRVMLRSDDESSATFEFDLKNQPTGKRITLTPISGTSLAGATDAKALTLGKVSQVQVIGNWQATPIDVALDEIGLSAPTPELLAARAEAEQRQRQQLEANRQAREKARQGLQRTPTSPEVVHIGAVDTDVLGITIVAGKLVAEPYRPYDAKPGDEIVESGPAYEVVVNGKIERRPEKRELKRDGQLIGYITGGRDGKVFITPFERIEGDMLEKLTLDDPASYAISSADGSMKDTRPEAVGIKMKPLNRAFPNNAFVVRTTVYLKLPKPLVEGGRYTIALPGLNTRKDRYEYTHDTAKSRSEAIHTQQIGYRPDDPYKRAFLSIWLGTLGAHTYDVKQFRLINSSGRAVHTGQVRQVLAPDGKEKMRVEKNYSQTAVYALDFSDFKSPGEYRVQVPGIGVSYPVTIGDNPWAEAFKLGMHGFLAQRSGIALGPPFTSYRRARDLHPADGVKVYRSTASMAQAFAPEAKGDWFGVLTAGRTDETLPDAWGGYHDAGDFDRASNHLWATYLHVELMELFPGYFERLKLALPPAEADDKLPDLLNEALWNLDMFRRLQDADGGVSGGIESSAHPRPGEDSVLESLVVMAYAPDVVSSYTYAAVAAKAARALQKYDPTLSRTYSDSAKKAFAWAEQRRNEPSAGYQSVSVVDARAVAAAELLSLTRDKRYDQVYQEANTIGKPDMLIEQQGGAFTYARLPAEVGDQKLKQAIRKKIISQADVALEYANNNAFGITVEIKDMPLIGPVGAFTTPGMVSQILPRAHFLTGDSKYLAGTIQACNFSAGANPDNMAMTTGVGFAAPIAPLHFDSRHTAQLPPAGLTLYGAYDHDQIPEFTQASEWVHTWLLPEVMVPPSRGWPATEGYVDLFLWPMMNELTIRQNMGPTSYYWGYLAGRSGRTR